MTEPGRGLSRRNGSGQASQVDFSPKEQQSQESGPWRTSCCSVPCTSVGIRVRDRPLGTASPGLASFRSLTRSASEWQGPTADRKAGVEQVWGVYPLTLTGPRFGSGLAGLGGCPTGPRSHNVWLPGQRGDGDRAWALTPGRSGLEGVFRRRNPESQVACRKGSQLQLCGLRDPLPVHFSI